MRYSQRAARRMAKHITDLETVLIRERRVYSQDWMPGATHIATDKFDDKDHRVVVAVRTAHRLGHAIVVQCDETAELRFMALPHPKIPLL